MGSNTKGSQDRDCEQLFQQNRISISSPWTEGLAEIIHIKNNTADFEQKIESLQMETLNIEHDQKGNDVDIKVKEASRESDIIYKIVEAWRCL